MGSYKQHMQRLRTSELLYGDLESWTDEQLLQAYQDIEQLISRAKSPIDIEAAEIRREDIWAEKYDRMYRGGGEREGVAGRRGSGPVGDEGP